MPKKVQILEGGTLKTADPEKKTADKVDNPDEFEKIISNIKTYDGLKKETSGSKNSSPDQQIYKSIFKEFKEQFKLKESQKKGDITWLNNNEKVKKVFEWVKSQFTEKNKYAPNSIYMKYHAFANLLLLIDKHNKYFQDIASELFIEGNKIKIPLDKAKAENNVLDVYDFEKFVPFDNMCLGLVRLNEKARINQIN